MASSHVDHGNTPTSSALCSPLESLRASPEEDGRVAVPLYFLPGLTELLSSSDFLDSRQASQTATPYLPSDTLERFLDMYHNLKKSFDQLRADHLDLKENHGRAL
jgi:hypothetical protein